jgi:hypothetical protein
MINLDNLWLAFRSDARLAIAIWGRTGLTADQQIIRDALDSHPEPEHISVSTKRDTNGGKQWEMFSIYTSDIVALMAAVESIFPTPNNALVLGAWDMRTIYIDADGDPWCVQLGCSIDDNGEVTGTPTYPAHPRTKNFMPDDVTYGADGMETDRTAASGPKQVNVMFGQSPRMFQ